MYCAKRFAYTYPVYKARNYVACMDYQHHKERDNLTSKKGEQRLHRAYSKRNNNWTSHVEKVPKDYKYIPELLNTMLDHFRESDEPLTSPIPLTPSDPRKQKRTLSGVSPPPTKSLFEAKKSRFIEESGDK